MSAAQPKFLCLQVDKPPSHTEYAQWVVMFMDILGIQRCPVIGHSDSAAPVVALGAFHADRVSHIILTDPIGMLAYLPSAFAICGLSKCTCMQPDRYWR